ncbi:MAG: adenylate/guanylate cyclase domain-containing protein [Oligoflexia bacterium]|nr:adenylate/guanylate cyclase domain-containing protein [Oligoflexia bacterium]
MRNRLWLWQLPIILLCVFAYAVCDLGVRGKLENRLLRERLFPGLRSVSTVFSDAKFRMRGPAPIKNKIVIVDVDGASLDALGRWPWHRDVVAAVIDTIFSYGAKVVGLDMVFSEPDRRIPEELANALPPEMFRDLKRKLETDSKLTEVIRKYSDRLVLGWASDGHCQPLYQDPKDCPVNDPQVISGIQPGFEKFAVSQQEPLTFDNRKTPLLSLLALLANLPEYSDAAQHAGSFDIVPDSDGVVRRTNLVFAASSQSGMAKAYPSLPLEMARVGLGDRLDVHFDSGNRIESLRFAKSGEALPVSPVGALEINFRGPAQSFQYVSVAELLAEGEKLEKDGTRRPAAVSKVEFLRNAYVLFGVSALGVYDMRAFPFDSNVPGVEGHANILDNILAQDFLTSGKGLLSSDLLYLIMILGGVLFAIFVQRLDAIPALVFTLLVFGGLGTFDTQFLFRRNIDWNTSFFFLELSFIFMSTIAAKYVIEERNKRFVRGAFAKYVAPAVVDSILKDPAKLTVGGEKRELTILFSDIRGFTTFSERLDARALASFLNDYLSIQTKIIFGHEGTLDKYIGDAIMAFWGAPLDQAKQASNACKAAIAMMQALAANRKRFKEQYGVDVDVGIGLNSGMVNVGNMGSNENFSYTVIGDHVNLASRLEGLTKYYGAGIVTSRFTLDMIEKEGEPLPRFRVLDSVKVKGRKSAVELVQILDRDYPADGLAAFEEARKLYLSRDWNAAEAAFRKANELISSALGLVVDGPSQMYIDRFSELRSAPPSFDWDGSWEMHSK